MNIARVVLAALGATVVYFLIGGLTFAIGPLRAEFARYPTIYRDATSMKSVAPVGMLAMFVAMVVLAVLFTMMSHSGPRLADGARFGALIGLFAVCSFVIHNYVNLNIGLRLTIGQAVAYFIEWLVVGLVIAAIYRPPTIA